MATGRVNAGGGGGTLNIFTQLTEPGIKEGVWLKTDYKFKKIVFDTSFFLSGAWNDLDVDPLPNFPNSTIEAAVAYHEGIIYYIGGSTSAGSTTGTPRFSSYNINSKTWTVLPQCPIGTWRAKAVVHENKIYLIGGYSGSNLNPYIYSYDIINNVWTLLMTNSTITSGSTTSLVNGKIYLVSGFDASRNVSQNVFVYDIATNTATTEVRSGFLYYSTSSVTIGEEVYMFGGVRINVFNGTTDCYKYNVTTGLLTKIASIPVGLSGASNSSVVVNGKIYVLGGELVYAGNNTNNTYDSIYVYDIATDTWSLFEDRLTNKNSRGGVVFVNGSIYIAFGTDGVSTNTSIRRYDFNSKQYDEDSLVLIRQSETNGVYHTSFLNPSINVIGDHSVKRLTSPFDDAFYFKNGVLMSLESYYGNSTQWIKFKEAQ